MTGVPALAAMVIYPAHELVRKSVLIIRDHALPTLVDLPGQDGGELIGEPLEPLGLSVNFGCELVIENGRRYGCDEAECRCKQRLGNTGGDDRQGGVLGCRDRLKTRHDAPDGTEQP